MSDFDERDASDDEPELNEEEVLEQLQELHRQLAERQKDEVDATPSLLEPPKKLIICATRRPVRLEKPFGEALTAASRGLSDIIRHRRDLSPSDEAVGGLIFDFERISGEIATRYMSHAGTRT